jgi:hypothetical protein
MNPQPGMKTGYLLIGFAAANAVLYSALLPLWEGFDEPFHFGYAQRLANGRGLPELRTDRLSREVAVSLLNAPASEGVKGNLPQVTTYEEFFRWTPERRAKARRALREIPPEYRWQSSEFQDYEAHQAPLAYVLLAVPERMLAGAPLLSRVLVLRILAALAGSLLLYAGGDSLGSELGLGQPYRSIAMFCVLATQMTWATVAHVANDWLAAPLGIWTLVFLMRCAANATTARIAAASLVLSAGLLTKAYFLALVPVLLGISAIRRGWRGVAVSAAILATCAGPWYVRAYSLYGDLIGTPQQRAGVGAVAVLRAAPAMNWPKFSMDSVRLALWTANNSFRTFSMATLNVVIAASVAGLLLWVFSRHSAAEWVTSAYCATFIAAVAYSGIQVYVYTRGAATTPPAWYAQLLTAPLLILVLLGTARWRRAGLALAAVLPLLFGYVLAVTYVFKLIPLYAGYEGRGTLHDIAILYTDHFAALSANLGNAALGPAPLIFGLTGVVIALIVVVEVRLLSALFLKIGEQEFAAARGHHV